MQDISWTYRRRFMIAIIAFCAAIIGFIVISGADSGTAQSAISMAFGVIAMTMSSYVFGATWQDVSLGKFSGKQGNKS